MRELTHEGNKDNLAKTVNRSKVYIQFNKNTNQSITEVGKHRKQKQHKAGLSTGFKTKQEIQKKSTAPDRDLLPFSPVQGRVEVNIRSCTGMDRGW